MLILLLIYKAISQVATTGILFVYCQVWVHGDNLIYWSMQEWNRFAGTYVFYWYSDRLNCRSAALFRQS